MNMLLSLLCAVLLGSGLIEYDGKQMERAEFIKRCKRLDLARWERSVEKYQGKAVSVVGTLNQAESDGSWSLVVTQKGVVRASAPVEFKVDHDDLDAGKVIGCYGIVRVDAEGVGRLEVHAWEIPAANVELIGFEIVLPDRPLERVESFEVRGIVHNRDRFVAESVSVTIIISKGARKDQKVVTLESLKPGERRVVSERLTIANRRDQGSNVAPELNVFINDQADAVSDESDDDAAKTPRRKKKSKRS